jgi:tRNA(Ile)-lysidine synthase
MPLLPDIARATVAEHAMLGPDAVVLALVSGGADSVMLLRLLAAGELGGVADLSVLHVNHLLRGEAADADAAFVEGLCTSLGVPCRTVRYDVAAYAETEGLNLEDAGRRVRYRFAEQELDARCAALGAPSNAGRIATAHSLDDLTETFLMRLVTGSGPGGLRAIPAVRGRIVRPLIGVRRNEITTYLEALGQPWREDATNADTARLRSWVRHQLKPLVERVNPSFGAALERTVRIVADEDALLSQMADGFAATFTSAEGGRLTFDRTMMGTLDRAMARRVVRAALVGAFPEASRLDASHTDAIVAGMADESFARDLPFNLRTAAEYGTLTVFRQDESRLSVAPCLLDWPGKCDLGPLGRIEALVTGVDAVGRDPEAAYFDAQHVAPTLVVDAVRQGDRIRPLGMQGTRKLQDVFVDAKIPQRLRAATPVVRDGEQVLWVAGVRQSDEAKVTSATQRVLTLCWIRERT